MCACVCQGEDPSDSLAQRSHSQHQELRGSAPGSKTSSLAQGAAGRTSPHGAGLTAPGPRRRGGPTSSYKGPSHPCPPLLSLEKEGGSDPGYSTGTWRTAPGEKVAGHRSGAPVWP